MGMSSRAQSALPDYLEPNLAAVFDALTITRLIGMPHRAPPGETESGGAQARATSGPRREARFGRTGVLKPGGRKQFVSLRKAPPDGIGCDRPTIKIARHEELVERLGA